MFSYFNKNLEKDEKPISLLEEIDNERIFNLDKYKEAGKIAELALNNLKSKIIIGKSILELCIESDNFILNELSTVYKDNFFTTGIAFPTCISINNMAGYNSPLPENDIILENNVLVKIELGVHIDGFMVIISDTIMLGEPNEKQQLVLSCLNEIKHNILEYVKIGKQTRPIWEFLNKTVKKYNCNLLNSDETNEHCPGMISSQIGQYVIDGYNDDNKDTEKHEHIFTGKEIQDFDFNNCTLQHNQVFVIDIGISSGNGNVISRNQDDTTIYRSNSEYFKGLRLSSSKYTLNKLKNYNDIPCCIRDFNDNKFKLGLVECIKSDIIDSYPLLFEHNNEYIANCKFTIILRKGNKKKKNKNIIFGLKK